MLTLSSLVLHALLVTVPPKKARNGEPPPLRDIGACVPVEKYDDFWLCEFSDEMDGFILTNVPASEAEEKLFQARRARNKAKKSRKVTLDRVKINDLIKD